MKKKITTRSAFFNPRFILCLIFCSAGAFLAMLSFGAFSNVLAKPQRSGTGPDYPGGGSAPLNKAIGTMTADAGIEDGAPLTPADSNGRFVYLIEFAEPGLMHRPGREAGERLDMNTPQAKANRDQLMAEQAAHIQAIAQAIDRAPDVTHRFLATHSGIATRLTQAEAQVVRGLPGVTSVARERQYELTTYRGPSFIGASSIWDGSGVPGGVGTEGEGMVIGMLDTGVDSAHPSFANDVACGHGQGGAPNKLITSLDCSTTDGTGLCNGGAPGDTDSHGSHTASTSGGNTLDATAVPPPAPPQPFTEISGVAPCANIRAYRVCPASCPGADIQAGMNSILLHGDVDVMNFSISGGTSPWSDNDRRKLDLVEANVLVAASAGNTDANPNPVGRVNHRGPWVMTVAASTRDGDFAGVMSASGPGTPPPETQNIAMIAGSASPPSDPLTNFPIRHFVGQPPEFEGCTPGVDGAPPDMPTFPAGFFTGSAALIHRGSCFFTLKIQNAFNAGAAFVVIRNNVPGTVSMSTPLQPNIPAFSIDQAAGDVLVTFVDANPTNATMNFTPLPVPGDLLADFSLRGPISGTLSELTKPDITGPGVNIYAAVIPIATAYGELSGTSMSSPHLAGAATLVRKVHPTWTVSEVKSALMMTAFNGGTKEDGTTPWDPDDVGQGRADLTKAARAGLVMNETFANYLAANPSTGGDPKTLNLASVRDMTCEPSCSWTRTVRNTVTALTTWTATGHNHTPGFTITVEPTTFNFNGGLSETQVLTITATPVDITAPIGFGEVLLTAGTIDGGPVMPEHRITVAINGVAGPTPSPTPTPGSPTPTGTPGSPTPTGTPGSPTPTPTPNPNSQAVNLSTRLFVQTGDNAGFGGFIITGTAPKEVLIRGIGPSLEDFGVPNALADPTLELFEGTTSITTNNNWRDAANFQDIIDTGIPPTDDLESAILVTLNPGAYTAVLRGNSNGVGVALIEIYDLAPNISKMGNISTRGFVDTGDNALIAGVIVGNGVGNDTIVVRGIGPSLADFGVPSPLANPTLELRNSDGGVVRSNNDWQDDPAQAALLQSFGLAPTFAVESGIVESLAPGAYTAILAGQNSGTGVGVVEVYDNPGPGEPTPTPGPPTPTPSPGTPTPPPPTPGPPCTENFDGVTPPALPAGWSATNPVPGDGALWQTTTVTPDTPPNAAFLADQDGISDKVLDRTGITVNTASAVLTFRNNFDAEFSEGIFWDGGVLEVSSPNISGGAFLDVTDPLIGGTITAGPYTGEISAKASNPLAGRMAWASSSGGYITSTINLGPNVNGQTITLRWRFGTDEAVAAPGWWIDSISIDGASCQ